MVKFFLLGLSVLALSFFVGTAQVNAQTSTTTPSPTPTMAADDDTPTAAPKTGFGN